MYSSSFNPIFNSLNNKYLTLPGFLGKSTAQIKILKNNSSNDPLSLTELTVKKKITPSWSSSNSAFLTRTLPLEKRDASTESSRITMYGQGQERIKKNKVNNVALAPSLLPLRYRTEVESSNQTSYVDYPHLTDNTKFLFLYFIVPIFFATLKNSIAGVHSSALRSAQPSFSADKVSAAVLEEKFAKAKESHALTKPTLMVGP